jgi:hypothetical protein
MRGYEFSNSEGYNEYNPYSEEEWEEVQKNEEENQEELRKELEKEWDNINKMTKDEK